MERPLKVRWKPGRNAVELLFLKDLLPHYLEHEEQGEEHCVRGAIVWPQGLNPGYVMLAAQCLRDGIVWIYEEREFQTVSPFFDGSSWRPCLAHILPEFWEGYMGRLYYYEAPPSDTWDPLHKRYLVQVMRERLIDPKPVLVPALYTRDDENADALVAEYHLAKRIRIERGGGLYQQLQAMKGKELKQFVAVRALRSLLAGFERAPWREPIMEGQC